MKKKVIAIVLAAVMAMSVAGCGSKEKTEKQEGKTADNKEEIVNKEAFLVHHLICV